VTTDHNAALRRHGPCPEHRRRFINVARAAQAGLVGDNEEVAPTTGAEELELADLDSIMWEIA
jgi:ribonuclease HII